MNITEVINRLNVVKLTGKVNGAVSGISYDSRSVVDGGMFFAIKGEHSDGHSFIAQAIEKGAQAVVYENDIDTKLLNHKNVMMVKVQDVRQVLAYTAACYYGEPAKKLQLIGITGTNGKTTTSYIIKSILEADNRKTGLIGTIHNMIGSESFSTSHTTPEAPEFQRYLKKMYDEGCQCVVTEVSSHALAQRRVDANEFNVAVFTNLTRDHLDYHKDMESYFNAKKRLFTALLKPEAVSIINVDDVYGQTLLKELKGLSRNVLSYGITSSADLIASDIERTIGGLDFRIRHGGESYRVESNLRGYVNVYNILAAFASGLALNIPIDVILRGISELREVKGRFEPVDCGQDFFVFIDYAHTDDALRSLLLGVRRMFIDGDSPLRHRTGKIITIFGCGGNRDTGKRPAMGKIATTLSDFTIITSDNPRHEDTLGIIAQIEAGTEGKYDVEPDRIKAIEKGIYIAEKGDIVLIAGKGHENYQEIKGVRYPFNDRETALRFLRKRCNGSAVGQL
ncbi:MAG: UDP-N-acetylmuramoyl-L-alanyl-D-glutamate--2,6-diaminopimelate ligase [Nitrospirae bacterium]|nr:UDP-N-acetylmuramoyl-L-alanyl-D-glutamate--2,6-diaminopimelate ligase [Nitrospirota bacterium]